MADQARGLQVKEQTGHDRGVVQMSTPGGWRGRLLVLALVACGAAATLCAWLAPGLAAAPKIGLFTTGLIALAGAASLIRIERPGNGGQTAKPLLALESATRFVTLVLLAVFLAWELVTFERLLTSDRGLLSHVAVLSSEESGATTAQWSTAWPTAAVAMVAIVGLVVVIVTTLLAIRSMSRGEGED